MRRFLDWLKAGGAEFSRLRVTTTARGGRGVVATAAFAPGDVLLRVPEPLLLTVDKAARRPDVAEALQRARSNGLSTNDGNLALALYLARLPGQHELVAGCGALLKVAHHGEH